VLATAEILIVNMWETDIGNWHLLLLFFVRRLLICRFGAAGRYTASNYGILKTVFEVNLELFKSQA